MVARVDTTRLGSLARLAAVVGLVAGLAAAAFVTVAGEPLVNQAIAIEEAAAEDAAAHPAGDASETGGHGDEVVVSRTFQRGPGLFGAYALTGAAFGLLLAVAFRGLRDRQVPAFRRAVVAGTLLAGAVTVAPWLKYPPNPPAVGDPATLSRRQLLYLGLILTTALIGVGAIWLSARWRKAGWSEHNRVAAAVGAIVAPMLLLLAALPPAPDPVEVPATLVWRFRLASLGGGLLLWAILIVGFGWVTAEADRRRRVHDAEAWTTASGSPARSGPDPNPIGVGWHVPGLSRRAEKEGDDVT